MGRRERRNAIRDKAGSVVSLSGRGADAATSYGRGDAALFALTLFLSAALLFTVEPMFAKMVLPLLGGAPAVWNACLVFYQAALLAGYLYAHLSLKWLGARRQAVLHLALLGLAWIVLPIHVAQGWLPPATTFPAPWLWMLLAVSLGLPFLAVSASAPMLQAWFARTHRPAAQDPYFLYAASNLGSLLALLAYPLLVEAVASLTRQSAAWAVAYGLLMALVAACAARLWTTPSPPAPLPVGEGSKSPSPPAPLPVGEGSKSPSPPAPLPVGEGSQSPTARRRLHWLALSLVPSSLLLGVTTYISAEIAPMPFLWVVPLALYLLTFVLVFAPRTILPLRWMVGWQPLLIVATAATLLYSGGGAGMTEFLFFGSLHLATFFVTAMVCHGQLAADRPAPSQLTEFYLWMSLGGVVGGLLTALVAPLIFRSVLEYPLMMAAACLLRPRFEATKVSGAGHHARMVGVPSAAKVAGTLRVPSAGSRRLPHEEPAAENGRRADGTRSVPATLAADGTRSVPDTLVPRTFRLAHRGPAAVPHRGLGAAHGQFPLRLALYRYTPRCGSPWWAWPRSPRFSCAAGRWYSGPRLPRWRRSASGRWKRASACSTSSGASSASSAWSMIPSGTYANC